MSGKISTPAGGTSFSSAYITYAVLMISFVHALNFIDRQIINILLNEIKVDLELTNTQLGILTGPAFSIMYVLLGVPIASFADRNVRRTVLAASVGVWSLMTAVCGMATGFTSLALGRVGVAIGEAGANPVSHALVTDYVPEKYRSTALAVFAAGTNLGILIGMGLGGYAALMFDWRYIFISLGILGIVVAITVRLTIKEPDSPARRRKKEDGAARASMMQSLKVLFKIKTFRYICLGAAFSLGAMYSSQAWTAFYFIRFHGMQTSEIGLWLGATIGIGGAVGLLVAGRFADWLVARTGKYEWHPIVGYISIFIATPLFLGSFLIQNTSVALFCGLGAWVFVYMWFGPAFTIIQKIATPDTRALAPAAVISFATLLGLTFGPLTIGIVTDILQESYGERGVGFALAGVVSGCAFLAGVSFWLTARSIKRTAL